MEIGKQKTERLGAIEVKNLKLKLKLKREREE
jgi:hypothetical protein